jgi:phage shock protein A
MSEHYDPDIKALRDYEALNADTRNQLSAALSRIAELERSLKLCNESCGEWADDNERLEARIAELEGDLSIARLQRDAKLSSQTAVDEAQARHIAELEAEYQEAIADAERYRTQCVVYEGRIEALERTEALLRDRIEAANNGECRFNCRTQRAMFRIGYHEAIANQDIEGDIRVTAEQAYDEWSEEND